MSVSISYTVALEGIVDDKEDQAYLLSLLEDHKNWGAFRIRNLPSHLLVAVIDAIKQLKEQQIAAYGSPARARAE